MSKGGGSKMQWMPTISGNNSTSQNNIPEWLTKAAQGGIDYAGNLLKNPGQAYGGQLTAGLNGTQNYAGNLLYGMLGSSQPYYDAAMRATQGGMQQGPNVNAGTYKQGLSDINSYMNPYVNNVVKSVQDLGEQGLKKALTQTGDQAISAGAFGGSRHGVQEGIATAQNNLNTNNQIANLLNSGYNNATNLMGQDISNKLQADTLNQANYNNYANRMLAGGNQFANIGTQQRQANVGDINNLMNWGNQQQQTQQNQLSAQYQEWLRQQNLPYQALQAYNQTVQGAPHSTNSNTNSTGVSWQQQQMPSSNPWGTALGIGAGLGGLYMSGGLSGMGGLLGSAANMFGPHDVYGAMGNQPTKTFY